MLKLSRSVKLGQLQTSITQSLNRWYIITRKLTRLVSHALWLTRRMRVGVGPWLNAAYVEGVATHADRRGRGYGSAVMRRVQRKIAGLDLGALATGLVRAARLGAVAGDAVDLEGRRGAGDAG